jgi:hypothetical protein
VVACPSAAISGTQYSDEQILAQLEGLLSIGVNGNGGVRVREPEVAMGDQ